MAAGRGIALLLFAAAAGAFGVLFLQRREGEALEAEVNLRRRQAHALADAEAQNRRLRAEQVPDAEVERLRADHAALTQWRAEIGRLEDGANRKARALAEADQRTTSPSLIVSTRVSPEGAVFVDGAPANPEALRARLAAFSGRLDVIQFQIQAAEGSDSRYREAVTQFTGELKAIARDLKVHIVVRMMPRATDGRSGP